MLRVQCPGRLGSCSPMRTFGVLRCVYGVLGHSAPVRQSARSVILLRVRCPGPLGSCPPGCSLGALSCMCGVLGHLAPVHRCARSVRCVACAVFMATWLLFSGVLPWCVALRVRCPGPLGSCSLVCSLGRHVVCAVSWATSLLLTGAYARRVVLPMRCPGPLGSGSPVCPPAALSCVCSLLGHLAPVDRCAHSVRCVACAVSWTTRLLFICVPAQCAVLRVRCPGPLGSCSPVRTLGVLDCVCGVVGHLAPVHRCLTRCVVFRVRCPGPLGSCSPVWPLGALSCLCGVLGHSAPVHRCACWVRCCACAVSWPTWLLFTGVPARCIVLCVRCPGPLSSCPPVCPLSALSCVCRVLGHLTLIHRCAHSVCWAVCAVLCATWLLFTVVPARCVVLCVRCPRPLGSWSPVRKLAVFCCVCGVPGDLAPDYQCARWACCVVCAVSWAPWLLFKSVLARCVVLRVRCPGRLGSFSTVCTLGVLCCVCGVLGH